MTSVIVRAMTPDDFDAVVAIQRECFPAPFPEDQLWTREHLASHLRRFPEGQFVAELDGALVGSASSALISEETWQRHLPWEQTLGGFHLTSHESNGTTLYGADIRVAPLARGMGVGRGLYAARFELVEQLGLVRYGTACRMPDCLASGLAPADYAVEVAAGMRVDRTLTPLLRFGLTLVEVVHEYMPDEESRDAAALLEWRPASIA